MCSAGGAVALQHRLHVENDGDRVTQQHRVIEAGDRRVEADTEVVPVDRGGRTERHTGRSESSGEKPFTSRSRVTGRVVPRIVRSPSTKYRPVSSRTAVDANVMFGKCSASRKSAERTCLSRTGRCVFTEAASMDTLADVRARSSSVTTVPLKASKRPCTLLTTRCPTTKPTSK